ncbi:hypothetical protein C8J56DRAFT_91983 [Mycena floridula]|nr:hypothetical protein C8J56DRAFT_91983 [Mycena floridula]
MQDHRGSTMTYQISQATMPVVPFPHIPDDITRLILEEAVEDDRLAALTLVLVARHVRKWIQPLLFRVVYLSSENWARRFLQVLTANPAFGRYVRTITFYLNTDAGVLAEAIISHLPNLHGLALWIPLVESKALLSSTQSNLSSLRRLSLTIDLPSRMTKMMPLLPCSLTHLELYAECSPLELQIGLKHLTQLAHLLIYSLGHIAPFVDDLVLHMPQTLQQLVVIPGLFDRTRDLTRSWFIRNRDPRVIIFVVGDMDIFRYNDDVPDCIVHDIRLASDWLYAPRGHLDIWEHAAEMQQKLAEKRDNLGLSEPTPTVFHHHAIKS